jgi:hypothetical protein
MDLPTLARSPAVATPVCYKNVRFVSSIVKGFGRLDSDMKHDDRNTGCVPPSVQ